MQINNKAFLKIVTVLISEPMPVRNSIAIEENGNITFQDATSGYITINTNNPVEAVRGLKQLNTAQLDSLLQIAEKQKVQFSDVYKTLLNGVAGEKNVVKGSITNVKGDVNIGDRIIITITTVKLN